MSFIDDIPNYDSVDDGDYYYKSLPPGIWTATQGLIRLASDGNVLILRNIINSISEKTGNSISTGWSWTDVENDIPDCVRVLHRKTDLYGLPYFMDTLEIIYNNGELTTNDLNKWLENFNIGYRCDSFLSGISWFYSDKTDPNNDMFTSKEIEKSTSKTISKPNEGMISMKTKVFIVHGHDELSKVIVARSLEKMGFNAIILHEQPDEGKTIIEKIEKHTNVSFAVVIYTDCDIGRDKTTPESNNKFRARQNVVFEHGYLISKLGRDHVCALVKGDIETPGDISGVIYTPMDDGNSWETILYKNMKAVGINVDMNKLLN